MSTIPSVKVYETITPANAGTGEPLFVYDRLAPTVGAYALTHSDRSARFWNSEGDSLEELSAAKQLAMEYLLRTALKGVEDTSIDRRDLWAERFTQASIELSGEPEPGEVKKLLTTDLQHLRTMENDQSVDQSLLQFLGNTYRNVLGPTETIPPEESEPQDRALERAAITAYGGVLREKYQPVFDLVGQSRKETFRPEDLEKLFTDALQFLANNDNPSWALWKVAYTDTTSLSVAGVERKIRIGKRRQLATPVTAMKLLAHELFVHALRSNNAHQSGDLMLLKGLPGFLDTEEGLGKLSEAAISGEFEEPGRDRYLDIALALGTVDGIQKTRPELFQMHLARDILKIQANGEFDKSMMPDLRRKAWGSVDRVYRGGRGDDKGLRQAVYTKDIAYYNGYRKDVRYICQQLAAGKTMTEIFDYLAIGSFDPTNPKHAERVAKLGK
jgi:hypothetical protein